MKSTIYLLNRIEYIPLLWIVIICVLNADNSYLAGQYLTAKRDTKEVNVPQGIRYTDIDHSIKNPSQRPYPKFSRNSKLLGFEESKAINNPPVVKIIAPENNSFFHWNSQVSYAIQVRDVEDGDSDQLEIASHEVFLEVVYVPDPAKANDYIQNRMNNPVESPGFLLLKTSDCFNCHAMKSRIQGPSFFEIAKQYAHTAPTAKMLAERVIQGSSGVWGISAMSSHPELTVEQASQIIEWIFNNAEDPDKDYFSGTKGTFPIRKKPESEANGVYVLTANYTDHGSAAMPQRTETGKHTIVLHSK